MKNLLLTFSLFVTFAFCASSQPVSEYTYKLDNGINVKTEHCWNQVWVRQDYAALKQGDKSPLSVSTRILGDLTTSSSFKLFSGTKEIKVQGAAPGTYNLKMIFKLSGTPGTLSFMVGNVVIKPDTKTNLSVTLYDYQLALTESASPMKGLSALESKVCRYKGNTDQKNNEGNPLFFEKGKHDKPVAPEEAVKKTSVKIKPGVYDVLISLNISGQVQKLWLENFTLKPDKSYTITTNLNGGEMAYSGVNREIRKIHLYPAGTADKQTGKPAPVKNLELGNYDNLATSNSCAPGSYDVLLATGNGNKYEWRKNLVVKTGYRTDVK